MRTDPTPHTYTVQMFTNCACKEEQKYVYHKLAVHVERVLPVAELDGLHALAVQQAGSALLNTTTKGLNVVDAHAPPS